MSRKSFAVDSIEKLIKLSNKTLNLCDVCKGCLLYQKITSAKEDAWDKHRQAVKIIIHRCNSFVLDKNKQEIMPRIGK